LAGELGQSYDSEAYAEPTSDGVPKLFHFSQENARNTVEATVLRKQNFKLESEVRELTRKLAAFEVSKEADVKTLNDEIERFES
jgi:uncharacterized protein YlxW (UPF0749 family)